MKYMLGDDWREYFKYVVISARKPGFFKGNAKFRRYNEDNSTLAYSKVVKLEHGAVYSGVIFDRFILVYCLFSYTVNYSYTGIRTYRTENRISVPRRNSSQYVLYSPVIRIYRIFYIPDSKS